MICLLVVESKRLRSKSWSEAASPHPNPSEVNRIMRDIRVATVQFQHQPGDKTYNLGRVEHFVAEAARSGAEIIAFPEMCLTAYWRVRKLSREAVEALAEPVPDGASVRCSTEAVVKSS